jgi:hypothetical protein
LIGVGRTDGLRFPLPPNRTGGFPASGSPVGGVTSERSDDDPADAQEKAERIGEKLHPPRRVITMRNPHGQGARLRRRQVEPSSGLARRHWAWRVCPAPRGFSSPFLRPLAPGPLWPFFAVMDALTPTRSVAAGLGFFPASTRSAPREQVSLIHALGPPTIPSPTTCGRSASPRHVTYGRVEPRWHPHGSSPLGNSGLHLSLAGSPHHTGRIEFVILRTGRSPPAAPHPVSRRRSCSRLQVALTWRGLPPLRPLALSGALAAALPRHQLLRSFAIGRGKPAATSRWNTFS